jgi:hypothetical protein
VIAAVWCFFRGHHVPKRHPMGGFRCRECGMAGADLDALGFFGQGYVRLDRRTFSRDGYEVKAIKEVE